MFILFHFVSFREVPGAREVLTSVSDAMLLHDFNGKCLYYWRRASHGQAHSRAIYDKYEYVFLSQSLFRSQKADCAYICIFMYISTM